MDIRKDEMMEDKRRPFPLIADSEPVIKPDRQMQLYDNDDLITRMRANYRDKIYHDGLDAIYTKPNRLKKDNRSKAPIPPSHKREISKARETAKKDIKQKRQAIMDKKPMTSNLVSSKVIKKPMVSRGNELSRFGKKLEQETYILAELPTVYSQPQNSSVKPEPKKNNYDFLKKSQVYNHQERQTQRERQVAQELNLTRFED